MNAEVIYRQTWCEDDDEWGMYNNFERGDRGRFNYSALAFAFKKVGETNKTEPEWSLTTNIFELVPSQHMSRWVTPKRPTSVTRNRKEQTGPSRSVPPSKVFARRTVLRFLPFVTSNLPFVVYLPCCWQKQLMRRRPAACRVTVSWL